MHKNTLLVFIVLVFTTGYSQVAWEKNTIIHNYGKIAPISVTVGDIDNDGFPDIVSGASSGMSWFRSKDGQGDFNNSIPVDIDASSVLDVTVADVDGDGFNDIIYTKDSGNNRSICWMRNTDGTGKFATAIVLATTVYYTRIQAIDMDNDGDVDIVYKTANNLVALKNNGSATFTPQNIAATVDAFYLTDVDGDNLADLIFKNGYDLAYYQQNPDGTFSFKEIMDGFSLNSFIRSADIDGDGDTDIVTLFQNGLDRRIKWYKNNDDVFANNATLVTLPSDSGSSNQDVTSFVMEDLDGDGLKDIVMQNSFLNKITWYKNLGNSTFSTEKVISSSIINNRAIFVADINGDGKKDVATVGATNYDIVWLDNVNGIGTSFVPHQLSQYIVFPTQNDTGDIDGDGFRDVLLTSTNDNKLSWYRNTDGQGNFSESQKIISNTLPYARNGVLVDLNNDGKKDVLASSNPYEAGSMHKLVRFMNQGAGNFSTEQVIYSSTEVFGRILPVDVDGDGDMDIVCTFSNDVTKVFKNNGNGTFAAPVSFSQGSGYFMPVDIDNDGDLDLLVANATSFFWLENTNALGDYSVKHPISTPLGVPRKFVIGDINNDGLREVIYIDGNLGRMTINNDGTFTGQTMIASLGNSNVIEVADFDNDGDLDIVCSAGVNNNWPGFSTARFRWYENLGNAVFGPPIEIYFDHINDIPYYDGFSSLSVDDLDADGKTDIVFTISYYTELMWFKNKGTNKNQIKGKVRLDAADNGCASGSIPARQVLMTTSSGGNSFSTFTQPDGSYTFKVEEGAYATAVTTSTPYYPPTPASIANEFTGGNNELVADFCLQPTQLFDDLEISCYAVNDARPGFAARYVMVAKNKGTNPVTTSVAFTYNNAKIQFISTDQAIASQTANSLTFAITNLLPFEVFQADLNFQVNTIPATVIGDVIAFTVVNELEDDLVPENNTFLYEQTVVGAYDPNDMRVLEGEKVDIEDSGDYLHYIIRFQNTGNYHAERVVITTVLDDKLDWETMELETYSHSNRTEILDGNAVNFIFDAIYLPGVAADEQGSNGYVAFKIKPKASVVAGDMVLGMAAIYFDHNPAIITNQVATEFVEFLGVPGQENKAMAVYPNPVSNFLHLVNVEENYTAELYNAVGQLVLTASGVPAIDFSGMPVGVYLLKIATPSGRTEVRKIIKK